MPIKEDINKGLAQSIKDEYHKVPDSWDNVQKEQLDWGDCPCFNSSAAQKYEVMGTAVQERTRRRHTTDQEVSQWPTFSQSFTTPPDHWLRVYTDDIDKLVVLVELGMDHPEYDEVEKQFSESMRLRRGSVRIRRIFRVQNFGLWQKFRAKLLQMRQVRRGAGDVRRRKLFHGTTNIAVDSICKTSFDRNRTVRHSLGYGNYFATMSNESHMYTMKAFRYENFPSLVQWAIPPLPPAAYEASRGSKFPLPGYRDDQWLTQPDTVVQAWRESSGIGSLQPFVAWTGWPQGSQECVLAAAFSLPDGTVPPNAVALPPALFNSSVPAVSHADIGPPPSYGVQQPPPFPASFPGVQSRFSANTGPQYAILHQLPPSPFPASFPGVQPGFPVNTVRPYAVYQPSLPSDMFPGFQPNFPVNAVSSYATPRPAAPWSTSLPGSQPGFPADAGAVGQPGFRSSDSDDACYQSPWRLFVPLSQPSGVFPYCIPPKTMFAYSDPGMYPGGAVCPPMAPLMLQTFDSAQIPLTYDFPPALNHGLMDLRYMFLAQVLVGESQTGGSEYTEPPDCADSCVDDEICPLVYVTFDNSQAYPEYLLEYSCGR
ncbi:hypothetical protein ACOMHN_029063 [Nucella lapillus]